MKKDIKEIYVILSFMADLLSLLSNNTFSQIMNGPAIKNVSLEYIASNKKEKERIFFNFLNLLSGKIMKNTDATKSVQLNNSPKPRPKYMLYSQLRNVNAVINKLIKTGRNFFEIKKSIREEIIAITKYPKYHKKKFALKRKKRIVL